MAAVTCRQFAHLRNPPHSGHVATAISSGHCERSSQLPASGACLSCRPLCDKEHLRSRSRSTVADSSSGRGVLSGDGWCGLPLLQQRRNFRSTVPVMFAIRREEVAPGQESVWDYPRPPRLEPVKENIKIIFNGETIVDTAGAYRVLETSHPPVYYIPPSDIKMEHIARAPGSSFCEWKGNATWWSVSVGSRTAEKVAWSYENPTSSFLPIKGFLAFYASPMDACFVGEEKAQPQPGNFYGGWVTSKVVGPFKGGPGSWGW